MTPCILIFLHSKPDSLPDMAFVFHLRHSYCKNWT